MSANPMPAGDSCIVPGPELEIVSEPIIVRQTHLSHSRVASGGKFLWAKREKIFVRGVTYGTFPPGLDGYAFPSPQMVEQDFSLMSHTGVNAVRTYNAPPGWLLDIAERNNLRVLVGLQGERHHTFLHNKKIVQEIRRQVRAGARACAGHPAVLGYLVANEIPAPIVRWHGARATEKFLAQLCEDVWEQDPEALVSYANYPSTEYLELPFFDMVCFNVFLESPENYAAYLARLQNLAGNRPLLMTEIGLDSRSHGEETQAACLDWQVRGAFAAGCAGAFVYAWTDQWYRAGENVTDWDFGLTDRDRRPKAALHVVRKAFEEVPFSNKEEWPKVSVVVCTYNGSRTIRDCLEGITDLEYPNYETIVVDDGSTDGAGDIASTFDVRLIRTENQGLSVARNLGWKAATGEIVAYIDDDARPDPDWLTYLAAAFVEPDYAVVGGPNIPIADDGDTAHCVAGAPGGPAHVLLSDSEAEHVPGCNMAFRRSWLEAMGGFDPQFRQAGDDVDICWRTREQGGKIGFVPAAMVWHHYRRTARAYWKQQMGYGRAEAMLERKWPEKYNSAGYATWAGRIYVNGILRTHALSRGRIYQGTWGSAGYARLYQPAPNRLSFLPMTHEWQLTYLVLCALSCLGLSWKPLLRTLPIMMAATLVSLIPVISASSMMRLPASAQTCLTRFRLRLLTAMLYFTQPLVRLWSRMVYSLTTWRIRRFPTLSSPWPREFQRWSETWLDNTETLQSLESVLRTSGAVVRRGGSYDRWDLEIRGGLLGGVRVHMVPENYGRDKHMLRLRTRPWFSFLGAGMTLFLMLVSLGAALGHSVFAAAVLGTLCALFGAITLRDSAVAVGAIHRALIKLDFEGV